MDEQDLEWLEAVNAERRKMDLDKVSPENFEVIMDRLEKEWFDLVCLLEDDDLPSLAKVLAFRRRTYPNPTSQCPQKTQPALFVTTRRERTVTPLFSATVATSPCIKTAMVSPTSQKASGSVASAPCHQRTLWCVLTYSV